MKSIQKLIVKFIIFTLIFSTMVVARAESTTVFGTRYIKHDIVADDFSGRGTEAYPDNAIIEPGTVFQVDLLVDNIVETQIEGIGIYINFDIEVLEPIFEFDDPLSGVVHWEPYDMENNAFFPQRNSRNSFWTTATGYREIGPTFIALQFIQQAAGIHEFINPESGENRMLSLFFKVREDAIPGSEIVVTYGIGPNQINSGYAVRGVTATQYVSDHIGHIARATVAGAVSTENNKVTNITMNGSTGGGTYDYLSAYDPDVLSYDDIVVPPSVGSLSFSEEVEDPITVVSHGKVTETGTSLAGFNLDYGMNYFKTVVKNSSNEVVKEYNYKVYRLSNSSNFNVSAQSGSNVYVFTDNKTTVQSSNTSVDILGSLSDHTHAEYSFEVVGVGDTSVTGKKVTIPSSKTEIPFMVRMTPEDLLSKYDSVLGINDGRSSVVESTYTLLRASNDNSLAQVVIKDSRDGTEIHKWTVSQDLYELSIPSNILNIDIEITPKEAEGRVMTPGLTNKVLIAGLNTLGVQVNAPDGTPKIYDFRFNRVSRTVADLETLSVKVDGVEKVTGPFDQVTNIELDYGTTYKLEVAGIAKTSEGAFIKSGGSQVYTNLPITTTTHNIVVEAEDGSRKTYTVNVKVNRNTESGLAKPLEPGMGNTWVVDQENQIEDNSIEGETDLGLDGEVINLYRYTINVRNIKKRFGLGDLQITPPVGGSIVGGTTVDPLVVGNNTFTFDSVSQDGKHISRYIITVNRAMNDVASVESISITSTPHGNTTGNLTSGLIYTAPSNALTYTVDAVVSVGNGSVVDATTLGTFDIDSNPKIHTVRVVSEDGTHTKEYTITINRSKSADATLRSFNVSYGALSMHDILPSFINKVYTLHVDTEVDSIGIDPIVNHVGASYTMMVGSSITTDKVISLPYGITQIKIDVTSETGSLGGYTLKVNRSKGTNAKLNYLKLDGMLLDGFDADREDPFDLGTIGEGISSLDLTYQTQDSNATVSIQNNVLVDGNNTVNVVVTAHDGTTTKTYVIKVYREYSSSALIPDGGFETDDRDGNHELIEPSENDPYRYKVFVPYDTLTYSKNDFKLNLIPGSNVVYEMDEITLSKTVKNEFKFKVIAPNGVNEQPYIIEVIHMDSDRPKLNSISINGVIYDAFNTDLAEQVISLDGLINTDASSFTFDVDAPVGVNVAHFNRSISVAGKHTIIQEVTLTYNLVNVYKFVFTRTMSSDDTLSEIVIEDGVFTPDFNPNSTGPYQVDVGDKETINVTVDSTNPHASITGDGDKELVPGKNQITVSVESEDKSSTKDYELVVYRDLALTELKLGDTVIDVCSGVVSGNTVTYTVVDSLPSSLVEAYLKATGNHSSVTITGDANKVVTLDNTDLSFKLTARDNETVLNVVVKYVRTLSSDARLETLEFKVGSDNMLSTFNSDTFTYSVSVPYDFQELVTLQHILYSPKHPNTVVNTVETMQLLNTEANTYVLNTVAEDGSTLQYTIEINRGSYNFLESLAIRRGDGHIEEVFEKQVLEYNAVIYSGNDYFSFEWTMLPGVSVKDANTLINIPVETMHPYYEIVVVGDNGVENTYRVNVSKGVSTRLLNLEASKGILEFNPDTKNYEVFVDLDTSVVSLVNLETEDAMATIRNSSQFNNIILNSDRTLVEVFIDNQGYEGKYSITFVKIADQTAIEKISANDGKSIWDSTKKANGDFEIVVDHGVDLSQLDITARLEMPGGSYELSAPTVMGDGSHNYTILVTDRNGIEKSYALSVMNAPSDNNYLSNLVVNGNKVAGFNRYATEYEVYLGAEEDFVIEATAEDENATISISNHDLISDQDVVSVTVMSEKGNVRTYNVLVHKEKANTAILDTLSLKEATLSPIYNKDRKDYYVTLPYELDYINVLHTSMSGNTVRLVSMSTVDGNKVSDIPVGNSTIDVVVEAEDGSEFTYVINVHRQVKSENYLEDLSVEDTHDSTNYSLSPTFDKEKTSYTVMLPHGKNQVRVNGMHGNDLVVYGLDNLVIPAFPYIHTVRVIDDMNRSREYSITFTQAPSEIPTLSNLSTDKGPLDPVFEANKSNYHIDVAYETQDIELLYTKSSSDQIVNGAGSHTLNVGRNVFEVVVTSGNSSMTYTVTVNRARGSAKLDWLEVSEGTLSPAFSKDTMMYTVTVGNDIESITVNAGSDNTEFEVSGSGMHALEVGMNVVEVVVDAGSGTTRSYYVVIEREAPIVEPPVVEPDEPEPIEPVDPYNGDLSLAYLGLRSEELNEVFDSSIYEYTANLRNTYYEVLEVIAVARNPLASVEILGNNNFSIGEHDITIRVSLDDAFQDTTITVFVEQRFLESDIHEVGVTYIQTVKNRQTVLDLKNQMLNENEFLRIYYDGQLLDDTDIVGTGAIIKLVVDDTEYDSKEIVVLGDLNGDGDISIADLMKTQSFILGNALTDVEKLAADVTLDNQIMINDFMKIQSHILLMLDLHN